MPKTKFLVLDFLTIFLHILAEKDKFYEKLPFLIFEKKENLNFV